MAEGEYTELFQHMIAMLESVDAKLLAIQKRFEDICDGKYVIRTEAE